MKKIKYLIIGAGPSGLTLAHSLLNRGISLSQILVLEKENVAGGLCRSEIVDGGPIDIGGGHFLDVKHKDVLEFLFRFLPQNEWIRYDRVSKINLHDQMIDHPLESNLWQFSIDTQVDYLESIAQAGCVQGADKPEAFADWCRWKFGSRVADDYMLPYNRKIWSMDPNLLGTYWLYKLPNVSFRETLQSCLQGKPYGSLPAHGVFLYPKKYGYGEVWRRMGEALGSSLKTKTTIESVDIEKRIINKTWEADYIFNSAPWESWLKWTLQIPSDIEDEIRKLYKVSIDVDYKSENLETKAHWIYEPDESIPHHRKLIRSNFVSNSRGYWTETNSARSNNTSEWRHRNEFAYPVNTINKRDSISKILDWAKSKKIIGFGRWGTWEHMNSDIAVKSALELSMNF